MPLPLIAALTALGCVQSGVPQGGAGASSAGGTGASVLDSGAVAGASPGAGATGAADTAAGATGAADTAAADTAAERPLLEGPLLQFADGQPPKNVLIISIDTLRRDHVGRYSDGESLTPNIDWLLSEGVALDHHHSCSNWTYASMICALGGLEPMDMGFFPQAGNPQNDVVTAAPLDTPMVSRLLAEQGYATGLVTSNPYLSGSFNFDLFYEHLISSNEAPADEVITTGLTMLESLKAEGGPWLLHLHFFEPHSPYDPPEALVDGSLTALGFDVRTHQGTREAENAYGGLSRVKKQALQAYAERMYSAEVADVDSHLGDLLEALDVSGDLDDTLVMLLSDHGEQIWQRGNLEHGSKLYSEESDPVAGFWAKDIVPGSISSETGHIDLAPTLLTGLGFEPSERYTGRAIQTDQSEVPLFSTVLKWDSTLQSVDLNEHRLIYSWDGSLEYYDLSADPDELDDRFDAADEGVLALWALLKPRIVQLGAYYTDSTPLPSVLDAGTSSAAGE